MEDLNKSKKVLITGCSSGFGKLMVQRFVEGGWQVLGTTRHSELYDGAPQSGLTILPCNVASKEGRQSIVEFISTNWSHSIDCLINNAGYGLAGPLESLTEEQMRHQFEVNFFAPLLLTRDLLAGLRKTQGRIINISSVLGFIGMPLQSLYAASKFALEGLSESLFYELATHGVQICIVEPGGFRTQFKENLDFPPDASNVPLYQIQLDGLRGFLKKLGEGPGNDPAQVADVVFKLANSPKMPLRVRVGKDARALYYLRRVLPQKLADRVFLKISNRMIQAKP